MSAFDNSSVYLLEFGFWRIEQGYGILIFFFHVYFI